MTPIEALDLGKWAEGVVEQDPMSGRFLVRMCEEGGQITILDVQDVLEGYRGQHVRVVITPFSTIERLNQLVASGEVSLEHASYDPPKGS